MNILKLISSSLVIMCFSVFFISATTVEPITENPVRVETEFSTEPMLGEVILFAGTFAPRGWEKCEGQQLSIAQYEALFALLGTNYGGDGRTTFALPKIEGPVKGMHYIIATTGTFPSRH